MPVNPELPQVQLQQVRYRAAREAWCSLPAFHNVECLTFHVIPVTGNFIHGKECEMSVPLATNTRWGDWSHVVPVLLALVPRNHRLPPHLAEAMNRIASK